MNGDKMKWVYSFVLLIITLAWAGFTVLIVRACMANPNPGLVFEASGASALTGALITWNALVVQFWFRKNPENGKNLVP
jgi:hypothetical protein